MSDYQEGFSGLISRFRTHLEGAAGGRDAGLTPEQLAGLCPFARWLAENLSPARLALWRKIFYGWLALLVVLNLVVSNHHPHFGVDRVPGFWPAFSFLTGAAMILFVKKLVQPLIKRPEDYYGDL